MKKYLLLSLTLFGSISYAMLEKEDCDQELHSAISKRDEAAIKLLLDNGADANHVQATSGMPPLQWAITWDNEAAVRLLLDHGADVNTPDRLGCPPFHMAVLADREAIARLLLERGSDPFAQIVVKIAPSLAKITSLDSAKSDAIRELIKNEISKRRATIGRLIKKAAHPETELSDPTQRRVPELPPEIIREILEYTYPSDK